MTLDPNDHTVPELKDELEVVNDPDTLDDVLEAEREGQDRSTAKEAIERRMRALPEQEEEPEEVVDEADVTDLDAEEIIEELEDAEEPEETEEEPEEEEADEEEPTPEEIVEEEEFVPLDEVAPDEPDVSYPDPDSDEVVLYDRAGTGGTSAAPPPITGHDTIHLTDDNETPQCDAQVGAQAQAVPRSTLPENIDECQNCLDAS